MIRAIVSAALLLCLWPADAPAQGVPRGNVELYSFRDATSPPGLRWGVREINCGGRKCGKCRSWRQKALAVVPNQSSVVTSTDSSITIQNTYNVSQPATAGGTTLYGYGGAGYSDLDLAGLLAQYSRLAQQGQAGQLAVSSALGQLLGEATTLETARSRVAETLAVGQAASAVIQSIRPPAAEAPQFQVNQTIEGKGGDPASTAVGPLATQHCAVCHTRGGASANEKAIGHLDMGQALNADQRLAAIASLLLDEKTVVVNGVERHRMPLGNDLSAEILGQLISELSK
mgnify:CR=1 FL=1